jgi:hypothetical protein
LGTSDEPAIIRLAGLKDTDGKPYLLAHHVAAADHLERLIARARLAPRLTMSYGNERTGGSASGNNVLDITDSAAQARQKLNRMAASLPVDCWNVLFDVCGMGKGLQMIETERSLPRRSAKLILRIALEQLAAHLGLDASAAGPKTSATTNWLEARLPLIAEP